MVRAGCTLVIVTSCTDDDLREDLTLVWEVEPGRVVLPVARRPEATADGWRSSRCSVLWTTLTGAPVWSTDKETPLVPFWANILKGDYRVKPLATALGMALCSPTPAGGESLEAGHVAQEMPDLAPADQDRHRLDCHPHPI